MTVLHFDFETRNTLELKVVGLDRYVRTACPLMGAWAFNNDTVQLWQPHLDKFPREVAQAVKSGVKIAAWHSAFERGIFRFALNIEIPFEQFIDPSTYARYLSLPGGLESVGQILGLSEDQAKIKDGKRLIQLFCCPHSDKPRPPASDENTLFAISPIEPPKTDYFFMDHKTHPDDWKLFGDYCKRDVETERIILHKLAQFELPEQEKKIWYLDQKINDTGLPVNREFVTKALKLAERSKQELQDLLKQKTGLENPNSRDQMLAWAQKNGYPYSSLEKGTVASALAKERSPMKQIVREVLEIRKEAAKSSYKKFEAIKEILSDDDRLRHQFLYLGAARSGRWSGSGVQVQNLPRPIKAVEKNLAKAINLIETEDYDTIKKEYDSVIGMVTSCVRSAFQAPAGKKLVVCDLSAIENRVLGWMANCDSILKVYRDGLDPYVAFAVYMYDQPYDVLLKDKAKRQVAKSATLGCGYGLGPGVKKTRSGKYEIIWKKNKYGDTVKTGLLAYAENMGIKLTPEQAYIAQQTFRQAYPEVVQLWAELERAAKEVICVGGEVQVGVVNFSKVELESLSVLRMGLPSGRALHYINPRIATKVYEGFDGPYERDVIRYDGIGHGIAAVSKEDGGQGSDFGPVDTYGAKFLENGDQAISRDIFAHGMLLANEQNAELVLHAHDEAGALADEDGLDFNLPDLRKCLATVPWWAKGLPLNAEGYEGLVYKKT